MVLSDSLLSDPKNPQFEADSVGALLHQHKNAPDHFQIRGAWWKDVIS